MNNSQKIIKQIGEHYKGAVINFNDLAKKIKNNKIDVNINALFSHNGYDCPISDELPIIFHYGDRSKIIITDYDIIAVEKCVHQ